MFRNFGPAFGAQLRTLREAAGVTQDQLARAVSRTGTGVRWTQSRVGQVEAGDAAADLASMSAVALALKAMTGKPVRLADLLPVDSDDVGVQSLRAALAGEPVEYTLPPGPVIGSVTEPRLDPSWGQVEDRVAAANPLLDGQILAVARELYGGRSGTEERDHRAGEGATPQKRGRVTRGLVEELTAALEQAAQDSAEHDAALERGEF